MGQFFVKDYQGELFILFGTVHRIALNELVFITSCTLIRLPISPCLNKVMRHETVACMPAAGQ